MYVTVAVITETQVPAVGFNPGISVTGDNVFRPDDKTKRLVLVSVSKMVSVPTVVSVVTVSKILPSVGFGRFCKKTSVFNSVSVLITNML